MHSSKIVMEVSVPVNRMGVQSSASPSTWLHKGKTVWSKEFVYGADISGGNETVYNTRVQIQLMGRYIIKAGQSHPDQEDY